MIRNLIHAFVATLGTLLAAQVGAVPSFARQTGLECTACHVSWPELTSVGRQFKLGGYTLARTGDAERPLVSFDKDAPPPRIPLAAFLQASVSRTSKRNAAGADPSVFTKDDALVLQQASVLLAGRLSEHAGGFVQWSYDGIAHHSAVDNVDLRLVGRYSHDPVDLRYGLSLNNSPTVSDLYNSTPVWSFPFAGSSVAITPAAAPLIQEGLAQQVAGLTAYALWNRTLYAEAGGYRTADGVFSLLRAGVDRSEAAVLDGVAPYWRLGLQREWNEGTHSAMLGTFGLVAHKFPDPTAPSGPTDRFRDVGVDAQYQYVTDAHRISAQAAYIRERQTLNGSFAAGASANAANRLDSLSAKLTYYYITKYGVSLGYQRVSGDADQGLYASGEPVTGSANGRPDSRAAIVELNWLPWRDRRITLQYTAYQKFNGARRNYDGFGRNAADNDTLFLLGWFVF
jgi:hypothetical protein